MLTRKIVIGINQNPDAGFNGYRPGDVCRTSPVSLPAMAGDLTPEQIAETVFVATNSPHKEAGLAGFLQDALAPARALWMPSLSVGDTVLVIDPDGKGTLLACTLSGFDRVNEVTV